MAFWNVGTPNTTSGVTGIRSMVATAPSGITDGDLIIFQATLVNKLLTVSPFGKSPGVPSFPPGWVIARFNTWSNSSQSSLTASIVAWKIANNESGNYTISWTQPCTVSSCIFRATPPVPASPGVDKILFDTVAGAGSASQTSTAMSGLQDTNDIIFYSYHGGGGQNPYTPPPKPFNLIFNNNQTNSSQGEILSGWITPAALSEVGQTVKSGFPDASEIVTVAFLPTYFSLTGFQTDSWEPDFIQEYAQGPQLTAFETDAWEPDFIQEFSTSTAVVIVFDGAYPTQDILYPNTNYQVAQQQFSTWSPQTVAASSTFVFNSYPWNDLAQDILAKTFGSYLQQYSAYNNLGNVPTAFTNIGYPWGSLTQDIKNKPVFSSYLQQYSAYNNLGNVPTAFVFRGYPWGNLTQDILGKPFGSHLQQYNAYNNLGNAPTAFVFNGYPWNDLAQEIRLKPFNDWALVAQDNFVFTTVVPTPGPFGYPSQWPDVTIKPFNSSNQQYSVWSPQGNVPTAFTSIGYPWNSLAQDIRLKPFNDLSLVAQDNFVQSTAVLTPGPFGYEIQWPYSIIRPFNSANQQYSLWSPRGNVPEPFVFNAYPWANLTQDLIQHQRNDWNIFVYNDRANIPTPATPYGWMGQSPIYEIILRPFNWAQQQFQSFVPLGVIVPPIPPPPPNPLSAFPLSGKDPNSMAILAYTATQKLLFDYSDDQNFYVLASDISPPLKLLFKVSPSYAFQWYGLNGAQKTLTIVDNLIVRYFIS